MMSVLERLRKNSTKQGKGVFGVVVGCRLSGKTTLAGTLPGKTLMLQAAVYESGCDSAKSLAATNGGDLEVLNFTSVEELSQIIAELRNDETFDNLYIDGLSAITELKLKEPKLVALAKGDVWSCYRELGDSVTAVLLALKELTYAEKAKKPKSVWVTCALKPKQDKAGAVVDVELETRGNVAVTMVTKLGECVVTVLPPVQTEQGWTPHRLITKTEGIWPGRIDGLLSGQNPGIISPADLTKVLELRGVK